MPWYQEKCELLALGVCPAGAFQPGGPRACGSRYCMSMAQMVLIQSAYKLIAMSLYSLACGHFSQPVEQGCTCAWPADPHNLSCTSLLSQRSRSRCWTRATNLQSRVRCSSTVPASSPAHEPAKLPHRAAPSLTSARFSSWDWWLRQPQGWTLLHLSDPVINSKRHLRTYLTDLSLVWPCYQWQETLEDLPNSM